MFRTFLSVIIVMLLISQARAALYQYSGTFSGSDFSRPVSPSTLSGSWMFMFDDSGVVGVDEHETFFSLPLTTLNLTPNLIGATSFDLTNSSGTLAYRYGILEYVYIGGYHQAGVIAGNTDNWRVGYFPLFSGNITALVNVTNVGVSEIGLAATVEGSYSSTLIPEPAVMSFLAMGLLGLTTLTRRYKRDRYAPSGGT